MTQLEDLLVSFLAGRKEEYKDLIDNWKGLETKAQGSGGFAGLLCAACFAIARDPQLESWQRKTLTLALIAIVLCIASALRALWIGSVRTPPYGSDLKALEKDLLKIDKDNLGDYVPKAYMFQLKTWDDFLVGLVATIRSKGLWVRASHYCLAAASSMIAIAVVTVLWR